jgi:hypothetical protein
MSESAREEALRLARECWFDPGRGPILDQFERLIALARQRPGWVWVQDGVLQLLQQELHGIATVDTSKWDDITPEEFKAWARSRASHTLQQVDAMLAAAPKPEEKP